MEEAVKEKSRFEVLAKSGNGLSEFVTIEAENFSIGRTGELAFFNEDYQQRRSGFRVFATGEWRQMEEVSPDAAPPLDSDD